MSEEIALSIVVPLKDEAESLPPLHEELVVALERIGEPWEVVYVDDGSTDASPEVLRALSGDEPRVRVVTLARNYGQSTAIVAGSEAARGRRIATLDADGQNDPADLVKLWKRLEDGDADVVQGVRAERHDAWVRKASSRIANATRNLVTGDHVTDVGCSLRIAPRQALLDAPRFEGMHRFLPTLLKMTGATVEEIRVSHRPRETGETKYGIHNRLWAGLADLFMVRRLRGRFIRYETADGQESDT